MQNIITDVVVIGGGGAGLPAALAAIESGANVILLEKRFVTGGDASLAGGDVFSVESHLHKDAGITLNKDDIYKRALEYHRYDRVNPQILHAFINKSADTIRWLEEQGLEFEIVDNCTRLKSSLAAPVVRFSLATRTLTRIFKEKGGQVYLRTRCKQVLCGADGRISGVRAATRDGKEFDIQTRSVILCSGSFVGNKELLKKYFPYHYDEIYTTDALLSNTGDGISMAAEAGAALEDFCTLVKEPNYSFETTLDSPNRISFERSSIWVNKKGQRYLAEDSNGVAIVNTLIQQPGKIGFALYDEKIMQNITKIGTSQQGRLPRPSEKVLDAKQYLQKEAGNWDEIARWIGCDPGVLKATIAEYNSFCIRGHDDNFAKQPQYMISLDTPPFYAVKFQPLIVETAGPIRVNEHMEVLNKQDKCVPGLYAAGVVVSGWISYDHGPFDLMRGSELGFAINSGRIAGESAGKFVQGNPNMGGRQS